MLVGVSVAVGVFVGRLVFVGVDVGVAIGVAGMPAVLDLRGKSDLFGRELKISIMGYADLVASTANLLTDIQLQEKIGSGKYGEGKR